ncbi:MAG: hypothetical protein ACR2O4_16155 [Hyphomicrobiaceae bacterium]
MIENLSTTNTLAALIGLYFLAAGTGLLVERIRMSAMLRELCEQPMLGYLGGLIAFAIGGAIVAVHNDWSSFLSGFVSLIGWIALAEGVLMLAVPKWFLGLVERWALSTGFVATMGAATLIAGAALLIAGLAG